MHEKLLLISSLIIASIILIAGSFYWAWFESSYLVTKDDSGLVKTDVVHDRKGVAPDLNSAAMNFDAICLSESNDFDSDEDANWSRAETQ